MRYKKICMAILAAVLIICMAAIGKTALDEKAAPAAELKPLVINTVKYKHIHVYDSEGTVFEGLGEIVSTSDGIEIKVKECEKQ